MMCSGSTPLLHYWVAGRPIPGQRESGDQFLVAALPDGALVAVVDGLGHGKEACAAAKRAIATLAAHAHEPILSLTQRCHDELKRTRGAVMTLASFDGVSSTLTWLAIGNVEGVLLRATTQDKKVSVVPRGGILGHRLPALVAATVPVCPGDFLIFATDGIGSAFTRELRHVERPQQLVNQIFYTHARTTDDALVLGVQWMDGKSQSTGAHC